MTKKQIKNKRLIYYFLSRFISRIIPLGTVIHLYGIFQEEQSQVQLTGMFILSVGILTVLFYNDLKKKFGEKWKQSEQETRLAVMFFIIYLFIQWAKSGLFQIETLVLVLMITQVVTIYPSMKHRYYKKEEKEKEDNN